MSKRRLSQSETLTEPARNPRNHQNLQNLIKTSEPRKGFVWRDAQGRTQGTTSAEPKTNLQNLRNPRNLPEPIENLSKPARQTLQDLKTSGTLACGGSWVLRGCGRVLETIGCGGFWRFCRFLRLSGGNLGLGVYDIGARDG